MLDIDKLIEGMVYKGESKLTDSPFPPPPLKDDGPERCEWCFVEDEILFRYFDDHICPKCLRTAEKYNPTHYKTIKVPGKSPFPEPQHPYLVPIPNGYQFCPECELLTPHTLNSQVNPSKAYPEDWTCDVCNHEKFESGYECPRCGWEHEPERDISPVSIKIKKHTTACWNMQQKIEEHLGETCNCPEVDAYPIQKIFNYRSSSLWNMECSNSMEWSYDIMCNVCNYVFEVEDGNC